MLRFGLPDKILHDQGGEFENDLFKELAKLCGVKRIRTTPYHPQTNGKVERMNQTIISMLLTLPDIVINIINTILSYRSFWIYHTGIEMQHLLKVNNKNFRTNCKICSKLTIKTPDRRH